MNTKIALIVLAALLAGATAFYANRAADLHRQLQQTTPAAVSPSPAPPPNLDTARLRKLLDEREAAYVQLDAAYRQLLGKHSSPQQLSAAAAPVVGASSNSNTNRLSWSERMKQEDPERYKQMMAERDQRRKAMDQWFQDKVTVLDQRVQSAPTQQEAELAGKIAENLTKLNELQQQWASVRELPEDQREAAIEQLRNATHETYQNLRTLGTQDRQLQLQNLAQSVGYTSTTDIQKFTTAVGSIYQTTDYTPHGGGTSGGHGGDGGGHRRGN